MSRTKRSGHTDEQPEILLRTSERSSFKRCRWQWERAFVDCIKPRQEAPALRFGSLIHAAVEKRYPRGIKRGPHPAKTFERLYKRELEEQHEFGFRDEDGTWHDALELGLDMLRGYVALYGKDEEWRVLSSEHAFQVPVFDDEGNYIFTYVGVVDGLWQHRQTYEVWIRDYKTCQAISIEHLALDDQMGSYWTYVPEYLKLKGVLKPNHDLMGLMVDFLVKRKGDTRPVNEAGQALNLPKKDALLSEYQRTGRKLPEKATVANMMSDLGTRALQLGDVSERQSGPRYHREPVYRSEADRRSLRARVLAEAGEIAAVRAGELTVYKNPGGAPPLNNCRFCGYRDICELHESEADWELLRDASMTTWAPYSQHEVYMGR